MQDLGHKVPMEQAKRLIDLAKRDGADTAKIQSNKADTLASKHSPAYDKETTQSQHLKVAR